MRQLNVRILLRFINRGHFVATLAGGLERNMGDTLNLKAMIHLGIERFLMLAAAFTAFRLAEVNAAGQFADA